MVSVSGGLASSEALAVEELAHPGTSGLAPSCFGVMVERCCTCLEAGRVPSRKILSLIAQRPCSLSHLLDYNSRSCESMPVVTLIHATNHRYGELLGW
jgi:hypothetical protein